jgi:DNA-entry nuclease
VDEEAIGINNIPPYAGQAYISVQGNIPSFSPSELTTEGYETYSPLDSLGRTRVAIASLGKETMPKEGEVRGDISSIKPSGWNQSRYSGISGGWLYNRCHLIGWQLSAENANKSNLLTGTKYFNIEGMLPFENMVADYIKETGNHVAYRVTPIYSGDNLLSAGVQIEAYSIEDQGEGICFNVFCYNVQPGISINYATGASVETSSNQASSSITSSMNQSEISSSSSSSGSATDDSMAPSGTTVYLPASGQRYHKKPSCGAMKNGTPVKIEDAQNSGYTPCGTCYKK